MWRQAESYGGPVLTGPCLTMAATRSSAGEERGVDLIKMKNLRTSPSMEMKDFTISPREMPNLTTLPMEMLLKIFKYLSIPDIGNVLMTSRRLRSAGEEMVWREEEGSMPGGQAEVTMTVRTRGSREDNHLVNNEDVGGLCPNHSQVFCQTVNIVYSVGGLKILHSYTFSVFISLHLIFCLTICI